MVPEAVATMSVEEFWNLGSRYEHAELVGGQVVEMTPPGFRPGAIAVTVSRLLHEHVAGRGLGIVVAETGFILSRDPGTVRAPDVAVVLAARVPPTLPARFFPGPPDLAVEILSPDDRPGEIAAKVADYVRAGSLAVWVIDPDGRTLTVHAPGGATRYADHETLESAPPFPDFHLPVRALLGDPQ